MRFLFLLFCFSIHSFASELLVYKGEEGPGKGKHIVFLASDHEYRGEETSPALARLLAKRYGFKCTVLFGLDDQGFIKPGSSNIPGMSSLDSADLLFVNSRFLAPADEEMKHFDDYIRRGGPVMGLRTSTHAFNMPKDYKGKYGRYHFRNEGNYVGGFGRQVLGETWAGHYGKNHVCSTRILVEDAHKTHPVLTGIGPMHVQSGGYTAKPQEDSTILAMATVLETMDKEAKPLEGKVPQAGIWVRSYKGDNGEMGRVFTSTHGASQDILDNSFRRAIINGVFWTLKMENEISASMNIDFVGEYNPIDFSFHTYHLGIKPLDIQGWESPIWSRDTKKSSRKKPKNKKKK
ncbi:MAG: ThuA domain-containing protein [Lentisphaeraceae bacterium]|nr:ThuA domain-containing protein [Lentisphaeraceae bacterium]